MSDLILYKVLYGTHFVGTKPYTKNQTFEAPPGYDEKFPTQIAKVDPDAKSFPDSPRIVVAEGDDGYYSIMNTKTGKKINDIVLDAGEAVQLAEVLGGEFVKNEPEQKEVADSPPEKAEIEAMDDSEDLEE